MISDEALMLEFQGGSQQAFEELFARYRGLRRFYEQPAQYLSAGDVGHRPTMRQSCAALSSKPRGPERTGLLPTAAGSAQSKAEIGPGSQLRPPCCDIPRRRSPAPHSSRPAVPEVSFISCNVASRRKVPQGYTNFHALPPYRGIPASGHWLQWSRLVIRRVRPYS